MNKSLPLLLASLAFTSATLVLGYAALGWVTMLIFTAGFLGGFLLWLVLPSRGTWADLKTSYWLTLALFLLHRVEEKVFGFFDLLSQITGVATPDIASWPVVLLVLASVGGWLLIPYLVKHGHPFGYYLAWTFFASMGLTELAHFLVFPFLTDGYRYIPGMASVVLLAPAAWFGMWRLVRGQRREPPLGVA